jgi:hypothetical protein
MEGPNKATNNVDTVVILQLSTEFFSTTELSTRIKCTNIMIPRIIHRPAFI